MNPFLKGTETPPSVLFNLTFLKNFDIIIIENKERKSYQCTQFQLKKIITK